MILLAWLWLLIAWLALAQPVVATRSYSRHLQPAISYPSNDPALAVSSRQTPVLHVFLVAGQSNAEGSDSDPILPEDAPNARILHLQCCSSDGSKVLPVAMCYVNVSSDPMLPCQGGHGISFARPFARQLLSTLPADDLIILVQTAIGGTGFGDGTWIAYQGPGFLAAVAKLEQAWKLVHIAPYTQYQAVFDGVIWHQGEMDAGDNSRSYVANTTFYLHQSITPMIAALRNVSYIPFSSPTLPFVLGQLLPQWVDNSTHAERAGVRDAIALLPQYVPFTGVAPSQGLLGDPLYRSGWDNSVIHFTGRSHRIFGKRYFAAYQAALVNSLDSGKSILTEEASDVGSSQS